MSSEKSARYGGSGMITVKISARVNPTETEANVRTAVKGFSFGGPNLQ